MENSCWLLECDGSETPQREEDASFVGGKPRLPAAVDLPLCHYCGMEQTFFFQAAFPCGHAWSGMSLAVFACTSCIQENHYIPALLRVELKGANIPAGFLVNYQTNFRFLTFPTNEGRIRENYSPKVRFTRWLLKQTTFWRSPKNKIGGVPRWILGNEKPATYNSTVPMAFLLQLELDFRFDRLPGAPGQALSNYVMSDGTRLLSPEPYYNLFVASALYLFGTQGIDEHLVYAIVQS